MKFKNYRRCTLFCIRKIPLGEWVNEWNGVDVYCAMRLPCEYCSFLQMVACKCRSVEAERALVAAQCQCAVQIPPNSIQSIHTQQFICFRPKSCEYLAGAKLMGDLMFARIEKMNSTRLCRRHECVRVWRGRPFDNELWIATNDRRTFRKRFSGTNRLIYCYVAIRCFTASGDFFYCKRSHTLHCWQRNGFANRRNERPLILARFSLLWRGARAQKFHRTCGNITSAQRCTNRHERPSYADGVKEVLLRLLFNRNTADTIAIR